MTDSSKSHDLTGTTDMTFTRKPIVTPDGTRQAEIKAFAHQVLMATPEGAG